MTQSHLEAKFLHWLKMLAPHLPTPEQEARVWKEKFGRRFQADFYWPDHALVVEIEGGQWCAGRHQRGSGFATDCEKYNMLTMIGIRLLRFTTDDFKDPTRMIGVVEQCIDFPCYCRRVKA